MKDLAARLMLVSHDHTVSSVLPELVVVLPHPARGMSRAPMAAVAMTARVVLFMLVFFPCLTVSGRSNYFVWTSSIIMYRGGKLVKTPAFSYCQSPDGRYSESRSRMTPGCLSR